MPPVSVYFLRTCVLSGYTFLPIFLVCVHSGMISNLIVSYVLLVSSNVTLITTINCVAELLYK